MIKRRGGLEAKELAWLLFLFFLVQVANLFLFGDVRFSSGVPGGHWGKVFIDEFPPLAWTFVKNGWLSYVLYFAIFWPRINSLASFFAWFFLVFIVMAIFDFFVVSHGSEMFFRFDLIGLAVSVAFVSLAYFTKRLVYKLIFEGC